MIDVKIFKKSKQSGGGSSSSASTGYAGSTGSGKLLKVTIPEDLDYTEIFDDIFKKYTVKSELLRVRTVNLGSMYELDYDVILKNDRDEKKMIDDIRVRNGNLTIVCGRHAEKSEQL